MCLAMEGSMIVGIIAVTAGAMVKPIGLLALPFVGLVWAGTTSGRKARLIAWAKTAGIAAV
jgi:hypothetical protein